MRLLLTCLLAMVITNMLAQSQTKDSTTADGEIRLSPEFMKELDNAFSFTPVEVPIVVPDTTLSIAQLHEWVGEPDRQLMEEGASKPRFDSTYFALKMYLKDFCKWTPPAEIKFDFGLTGPIKAPSEGVGSTMTIDVNALGQYLRPKERRLRKSRRLAEKNRASMDACYPIGDEDLGGRRRKKK